MLFKDELKIVLAHFLADGYETAPTLSKKESIYTTANGALITLVYPGKKYVSTDKTPTFDFRVDCDLDGVYDGEKKRLPTHAAFMIDMYNKVRYCGMDGTKLRGALAYIAVTGDISRVKEWEEPLQYTPAPPLYEDVSIIQEYYDKWKKGDVEGQPPETFNWDSSQMDWGIEELFAMIKYIAMQEDVNYPISDRIQGRKMPFCRYIEGIDVAQKELNTNRKRSDLDPTLSSVVANILTRKKVPLDPRIDYGAIPNITE